MCQTRKAGCTACEVDIVVDSVQRQLACSHDVRRGRGVDRGIAAERSVIAIAAGIVRIGIECPVGNQAGGDIEQAHPVHLHIISDHQLCLNAARLAFQDPVATQSGKPRGVGAGCDVGAGQLSQRLDRELSGVAPPKVAAIDHQVRIGREALADLPEWLSVLSADGVLGQDTRAEMQLGFVPFRDQVNGIDAGTVRESLGDLFHPVAVGVENDDLRGRGDPVEERL